MSLVSSASNRVLTLRIAARYAVGLAAAGAVRGTYRLDRVAQPGGLVPMPAEIEADVGGDWNGTLDCCDRPASLKAVPFFD
ncbi:hypothetical protein [Lichenihabitans psoromatis]|uniref:hypothetical protein n=1 Tax=Lichenihabitans psoromatis TaxID=2528642 RepID=UPI0013F169C9|nr:hypothetical protein [Lichenihabitans psoromatis]